MPKILFSLWCLILSYQAFGGNSPLTNKNLCFDFDRAVNLPLKTPPHPQGHHDVTLSGKMLKKESGIWGSVRGEVTKPIQEVYRRLLDHYTVKDSKRVKLKVYSQERSGYQDFHVVMVSVPTPISDIHWEEEWGYALADGTEAAPKKFVISYQKTTGTQYIPHLCGSIVLTSKSPNSTDVYLYEEVNALGKRSPTETVKGHLGTLTTLRGSVGTAQAKNP